MNLLSKMLEKWPVLARRPQLWKLPLENKTQFLSRFCGCKLHFRTRKEEENMSQLSIRAKALVMHNTESFMSASIHILLGHHWWPGRKCLKIQHMAAPSMWPANCVHLLSCSGFSGWPSAANVLSAVSLPMLKVHSFLWWDVLCRGPALWRTVGLSISRYWWMVRLFWRSGKRLPSFRKSASAQVIPLKPRWVCPAGGDPLASTLTPSKSSSATSHSTFIYGLTTLTGQGGPWMHPWAPWREGWDENWMN